MAASSTKSQRRAEKRERSGLAWMIAGALRRSAARMVPMTAWRSYTHIATLDNQTVVCRSALISALKMYGREVRGLSGGSLKSNNSALCPCGSSSASFLALSSRFLLCLSLFSPFSSQQMHLFTLFSAVFSPEPSASLFPAACSFPFPADLPAFLTFPRPPTRTSTAAQTPGKGMKVLTRRILLRERLAGSRASCCSGAGEGGRT